MKVSIFVFLHSCVCYFCCSCVYHADHYDRLSQCYDQFYDNETVATLAIKYLDLQPEDRLADVGGGTGGVAEIIHKRVGK